MTVTVASLQADTLRGFYKHTQRHPLSTPGKIDLTTDVDFAAVKATAQSVGAGVAGPVTQVLNMNKNNITILKVLI